MIKGYLVPDHKVIVIPCIIDLAITRPSQYFSAETIGTITIINPKNRIDCDEFTIYDTNYKPICAKCHMTEITNTYDCDWHVTKIRYLSYDTENVLAYFMRNPCH